GESPGAFLFAADRHLARWRRSGHAHTEGIHLLRDGLLGLRRDGESSSQRSHQDAGSPASGVSRGEEIEVLRGSWVPHPEKPGCPVLRLVDSEIDTPPTIRDPLTPTRSAPNGAEVSNKRQICWENPLPTSMEHCLPPLSQDD